ncbi:hypothetical protein Cgig2_009687 [Carnegiea gigantea]|uniref:Uncharacterized protein n=1 Tax=Carnegiea gigantea TaxID=171969 RepID=A0A9Q1K646_9CARY|nr:hypothetical protein Cgig2_009687 [Carnegiea gigantea]
MAFISVGAERNAVMQQNHTVSLILPLEVQTSSMPKVLRSKEEIFDHLVEHRMIEDYDTWYYHGESLRALGVITTLDMNQTVSKDDLNDDDDDNISWEKERYRGQYTLLYIQNKRTSDAASASTAEMEQNVTTQSGAQSGPSDGSPVKFIIPNRVAESYMLKSMGRKWSNFKADLKLEHYEPNRGNVTAIMNEHVPDCIPKDQWISLVAYWISDKGKKHSVTNRKSRANQVMVHTVRLKSFARVIVKKTVNGVKPSRAHVYVDTHKDRKTRPAPMDEKSKQAMDMINENLSQLRGGKELRWENFPMFAHCNSV